MDFREPVLVAQDPRSRDVLQPYLNGEDLNSRPDQSASRWAINFYDWPLPKAEAYPLCMTIVREKVKPIRESLNENIARKFWWRYTRPRPEMYEAISGLRRVLVVAGTSRTLAFAFASPRLIFSHALYVFALQEYSEFAVLQSAIHEAWARNYASSLKGDLRYAPTDLFENFPFPLQIVALESIGEAYYKHRQAVMKQYEEGLTATYNRYHSSSEMANSFTRLRELHVEMDQVVAAAYGWTDLHLEHSFHQTKQGLRFTISEAARREVLDRLLALNHQRYAEEVAQGLHDKKASKGKGKGKPGAKGRKAAAGQTALVGFGQEEGR